MPTKRLAPPPRSFAADAHDCIMVRTSTNLPNTSLRREIRLNRELPSDLIVPPRAQASRRCQTQAPLGGKAPSFARVSLDPHCARSGNLIVGDGMKNGFPGRVEDWRVSWPRHPDHATFPAPSTSHAACGFPALRAPICFTSGLMGPIILGQLSVRRVALDSC